MSDLHKVAYLAVLTEYAAKKHPKALENSFIDILDNFWGKLTEKEQNEVNEVLKRKNESPAHK